VRISDSIFKQPKPSLRAQAKQSIGPQSKAGLLPPSLLSYGGRVVAVAPRNDGKRESAFPRRDAPEWCMNHSPGNKRAQGMPGVQCTRSLACKINKAHENSRHSFTGLTRHSLHNGFNGLFRALPGDEFVLSPSSAD
jgi:hypothetical protein